MSTFDALCNLIPPELSSRSGKVFYSGRSAFSEPSRMYVLGVNPGGDPDVYAEETVGSHTLSVRLTLTPTWSAYRDESWERAVPGTWGMQPRVLHMFKSLGIESDRVPCSNLVFVRSRQEADLRRELPQLTEICWPFHAAAIERLRIRVVVCFGQTAGNHVRDKLAANQKYDEFVERNRRQWRSRAYTNATGLKVIVVSHPSRVDWTNPVADPTPLVAAAIA